MSATDIFRISKWFNDILTELCVFIENSSKKMDCVPSYLLSVKNQMDKNYAEPLSLDDLEATYRISRYRICREFSFHFGESPMRYLNSRRIDAAKRLLLTTDLSVHEVGSQVGIENTNHFINLFKKDTGTTPLQAGCTGVYFRFALQLICSFIIVLFWQRYPLSQFVHPRQICHQYIFRWISFL